MASGMSAPCPARMKNGMLSETFKTRREILRLSVLRNIIRFSCAKPRFFCTHAVRIDAERHDI